MIFSILLFFFSLHISNSFIETILIRYIKTNIINEKVLTVMVRCLRNRKIKASTTWILSCIDCILFTSLLISFVIVRCIINDRFFFFFKHIKARPFFSFLHTNEEKKAKKEICWLALAVVSMRREIEEKRKIVLVFFFYGIH